MHAQNKCNHKTKKCPNIERASLNVRAKTKTYARGIRTKMTIEYIQKHSNNGEKGKGKTLGQKQVEQMMGTREMSNEERKQSRKKNKKEMKGPDDTHRNIT
jgi:hypothetical protein